MKRIKQTKELQLARCICDEIIELDLLCPYRHVVFKVAHIYENMGINTHRLHSVTKYKYVDNIFVFDSDGDLVIVDINSKYVQLL
jgi:hypothetical protein